MGEAMPAGGIPADHSAPAGGIASMGAAWAIKLSNLGQLYEVLVILLNTRSGRP